MPTVLICGDRNWEDQVLIDDFVGAVKEYFGLKLKIIEGEAAGADTCAKIAAKKFGVEVQGFKPNWNRYGKAAGPKRNRKMLGQKPNLTAGFHNSIKDSKGTRDMLNISQKAAIPTILIAEYDIKWLFGRWKHRNLDIILERAIKR